MGHARYTADYTFPGLLHIAVVRSPYAHARILSVDVEGARRAPGVEAVLTGADVPGPFGFCVADQYPLAREKTRFAGEPVALVVAGTPRGAEKAASLVKVEYQPLPFVIHPKEAAARDAPVLHEGLPHYKKAPFVRAEGGNIYQRFKVRKGNAAAAFERASLVVEGGFDHPCIHHAQMEPHCAVARYGVDHSMEIIATTQAPFVVQECVAHLHGIPMHKVRVSVSYLGGGFGGKSDVTIEPLVSCAARAVPGRYVRLLLSREEMFSGSSLGRGGHCHYRLGFAPDGRLLAMEGTSYLGSGGNADYAINIVTGMALAGTGPYAVDDLSLDVLGVYTNTPPIGAARGYGHPEVHLAVESLMDEAATKLGIPPQDLRLKNLLRAGSTNGIGQVMQPHSGDVAACTRLAADELFKGEKPDMGPGILVGRGIASYMKTPCMPSNVQSGAFIKLNADGTATVSVSAVEMGQGTYTALGQIAAEALGIPFERVNLNRTVDTAISPYEWQTVASHSTWGVGNAILLAAADLLAKMKTAAGKAFGVPEADVVIQNGQAKAAGKALDFGQLALGLRTPDGQAISAPLMGEGYFVPHGLQNPDPDGGQSNAAADWTLGCAGVELGVDTHTGEISLYRFVNAIDAGTIINPEIARDQVIGAMVMAAGAAMSETLVFSEDRGHIRNDTLVDYKIPGIEDVPPRMDVMFVQTPEESGPFGAKGIGEHGAVATAPAILNALFNATGKRFTALPVTAADMLAALKGGEAG